MIPDIRYEAAILRAGLLLGLVLETDVPAWAEALLHHHLDPDGHLAETAMTRAELTAMREVLSQLAEGPDSSPITRAILAFVSLDPACLSLPLQDRLRVLSQLGREFDLPESQAEAIKHFEDRLMLARSGIHPEMAPSADEVTSWLESIRPPTWFRISLDREEAAAFLAAVSRKLVRDGRGVAGEIGRAWVAGGSSAPFVTLVLNDAAWRVAIREFAPLPIGSRLPYQELPPGCRIVLDGSQPVAMGIEEARALLAPVAAGAQGQVERPEPPRPRLPRCP